MGIPDGVKEVLGQRLARLGETATSVLQVAAIVGRDFELGTVVSASGEHEDAVLDTLDRTLVLRLVEETAPDRYRFSHALVRAALVDEVSTSRRVRVHRRVAEYLEQVHPSETGAIAHHWLEAQDSGDPAHTIDAVFQAAEQATERGGFDEAATLLARADARVGDNIKIDCHTRPGATSPARRVREERRPIDLPRYPPHRSPRGIGGRRHAAAGPRGAGP